MPRAGEHGVEQHQPLYRLPCRHGPAVATVRLANRTVQGFVADVIKPRPVVDAVGDDRIPAKPDRAAASCGPRWFGWSRLITPKVAGSNPATANLFNKSSIARTVAALRSCGHDLNPNLTPSVVAVFRGKSRHGIAARKRSFQEYRGFARGTRLSRRSMSGQTLDVKSQATVIGHRGATSLPCCACLERPPRATSDSLGDPDFHQLEPH